VARKALCFGVSAQSSPALASITQCRNDAVEMEKFLAHTGADFDVRAKVDPTINQMKELLFEATQACSANDQFLLYFSGHGRRGKNRKLYLCAKNTDPDKLVISGLSFDQILEMIRESALRSVLIILDCCYSGAAASSVLIKSGDDLLDEQTKESFTDGWVILTSTTSVETTEVYKQDAMSPFTRELISSCKKLQSSNDGWISVAQVYEELRYRLFHQRPTLFGHNPVFRVCAGTRAPAKQVVEPKIAFREWDSSNFVFYGLLVLPHFRAWILLNPPGRRFQGATPLSEGVDILYNHKDVFGARVQKAEESIRARPGVLLELSNAIGTAITLLFPIAIEEVTYRRFIGSDRKYILRETASPRRRQYPVVSTHSLHCVTVEDSSWVILETPEDYMKEAFGVTFDYQKADKEAPENSVMILKEDTISRNAKYISLARYTQQIINTSLIDTELGETRTTISKLDGADERLDKVISARRKRAITIGSFAEIETEIQRDRRARHVQINCKKCMDERKVTVEVNTRRYSVPCPECNWQENSQWKAFYDHKASPDDRQQPSTGATPTRKKDKTTLSKILAVFKRE